MKNTATSKIDTHKWPIQPNLNGVPANVLNNKNEKDAESNILRNLANDVKDEGLINKQISKKHKNIIPQSYKHH